jgi:hypothetical protein
MIAEAGPQTDRQRSGSVLRDAELRSGVAAHVQGARDLRDVMERFAWALDGEGMHVECGPFSDRRRLAPASAAACRS